MKRLYVLFDAECALCRRCRHWLVRQDAYVELYFIPLQSTEVRLRFPGLVEWEHLDLSEKLVVVSDEGAIYQGHHAWIMCLWALGEYREWALRLAHPTLTPLAHRACEAVSQNRITLSRFLYGPPQQNAAGACSNGLTETAAHR